MEFPIGIRFIPGVGSTRLLMTDAANAVCGCLAGVSGYQKSIVYTDQTQSTPIYAIEWKYGETEYFFSTPQGGKLGSVKRTPRRSVWRAHYVISIGGEPAFEIVEENPFVKVLDTIAGMIPVVGDLTGYYLNPTYAIARDDGAPVLRLVKERSFRESVFSVHLLGELSDREREVAMLALLMLVQRENTRG